MMAALAVAALASLGAGRTEARECPTGSYSMIDQWGNAHCRSFASEPRSSKPGPTGACPVGKYPDLSAAGNRVCRSFGGALSGVPDAPKPCRPGTYPWTNANGNRVCKSY
jgi:hypothetical protein